MDIEEIVRATVIALEERQMLKEWPSNAEMEVLIGYVMEMESARMEEECYDERQPDWHQEWHDFDPEA